MTAGNIHLINIASPFREGIADMKRPPSGILYVGGYLKQHGFPVMIHHIDESQMEETIEHIVSDDSILFVGFSLMTGRQVTSCSIMSSWIKNLRNEITIVWGGIHPSLMSNECLSYGFVDYVAIGEGEITCLELSRYFTDGAPNPSKIPGISFIDGRREIVKTPFRPFEPNIDTFRQDWSLIDPNRYILQRGSERIFYFITSRGCPHSCGFCYNQAFNLRRWRGHSLDHVVHEISLLKKNHHITTIVFDDDNFFTNRRRGIQILDSLKKIGVTCQWLDLRVDYISEELLSELANLEVRSVFMGWESGNETTLNKISKGFSPQTILEKTKVLAKFKSMTADASAIVGFPWESEEAMGDTISLMLKMFRLKPFKLNFNIGLYVPYPGAPVTAVAESRGFVFPKDYRAWNDFDILAGTMKLPWMTEQQIEKYRLIDRYAKLLFVPPTTNVFIRMLCYVAAIVAYLRIRFGVFAFPFEVWLQGAAIKSMLKSQGKARTG